MFVLQSDLTQDITTSVLWVNSKPHMITLDYTIQVPQTALQKLPEVRWVTSPRFLNIWTASVFSSSNFGVTSSRKLKFY